VDGAKLALRFKPDFDVATLRISTIRPDSVGQSLNLLAGWRRGSGLGWRRDRT